MADPLSDLMRPGFPKQSFTESGYNVTIEYVGIAADLDLASPALNDTWGDYSGIVVGAVLDPLEGTDYGILTVSIERKYGVEDSGDSGSLQEVTTEIDWVDVSRSMYEHPAFKVGGGGAHQLSAQDLADIKSWEKETNNDLRKIYKFTIKSAGGGATESELSSAAKMFARGIDLGIEYYVESCPVARWSGVYAGGPPPAGSAGIKQNPVGVEGIPAGYEWIRTADRGIKQGGQTRWTRNIEWTGARKVLVDSVAIFWTAP